MVGGTTNSMDMCLSKIRIQRRTEEPGVLESTRSQCLSLSNSLSLSLRGLHFFGGVVIQRFKTIPRS